MAPILANIVRQYKSVHGNPDPDALPHDTGTDNLSPAAIGGIAVGSMFGLLLLISFVSWAVMTKWNKRGRFSIRLDDFVPGREDPTPDTQLPPYSPPGWRNGRHPADAAPIIPRQHPANNEDQTIASPSRRRSYRQTSIINLHPGQPHNAALVTVPEHENGWHLSPNQAPVINYVSFSAFQNPLESRSPWGPPPPYQPGPDTIPSARVANHVQSTSHHGAYHADVSNVNESTEDDEAQPLFTSRRAPSARHAVGIANSGIPPSR